MCWKLPWLIRLTRTCEKKIGTNEHFTQLDFGNYNNYADSDYEASEFNLKANIPNCHIICIWLLVSTMRTRSQRSRHTPLLFVSMHKYSVNFRIAHPRIALIIVGKSWALSNISQQKESFGFREMLICEWRWCQVGFSKTHLDPLLAKGKDLGPRLWVGTLAFQQECGCEGKRVDVLSGQGSSSLNPISWILALYVVNLWVKLVEN